ncbi:helix-turn-helix domain-containing protein [Acetobacterium wieringae]|uniref:helix-turn-helix domain-containing protein n=1 Tax=Acetobacterium wieringae TaxID=52694 RepID=UPI0026E96E22|nr:helix-turn-helix domain-containing protein [Acetobacterium wieringae]
MKFEKGELRLSINQLEKICDLFSCSCNDLMEGITDELQQDYYFDFSTISSDDLTGISRINKIVRNSKEMNILLTGRLVQR